MTDSGGPYGKIESISASSRGEQIVSFSTAEALRLPVMLVTRHKLVAGTVITVAQFQQLLREGAEERTKNLAEQALAIRMYGTDELRARLREKGCPPSAIETVIAGLLKRRLLDDEAYAFALVRRTLERKPAGSGYLVALLRRKRLSAELARQVVDTAFLSEDETALALRALERRWRLWLKLDLESARRKAYTYLSGRGIHYDAARAAVDHLCAQDERTGGRTQE